MAIVLSGTTGIDAGSLPVNNCGNTEVEGNLNLSGVGTRITGDFSNATASNRVSFQTSTLNGYTQLNILPNGTSQVSQIQVGNNSDATNASVTGIGVNTTDSRVFAGRNGTGTYLPLTFYTSGSEKVRIDTAGNVGINITNPIDKLGVKGNVAITSLVGTTVSDGSGVLFFRGVDNTQMGYIGFGGTATPIEFVNSKNTGFAFYNGDILQKTAYGLGYGTGAGGTVTQLTSKTTGVTLNKPSGDIIMSNSALAAGASASFGLYNSLISLTDTVTVSLVGGASNGDAYRTEVRQITPGQIVVRVVNISGGSLSEAITIHFNIHKGANA